jgi:hypothetical protein
MTAMLNWILLLLIRHWKRKDRARWLHRRRVVRFDGSFLFWRHELFWPDEWISGNGKRYNRPPWWRPFNAFLHKWCPTDDTGEGMHDHPRWSITICLRGRMIEHTPWGDNHLKPGSVVLRSRKYIHSFSIPKGYSGKTWTLFIVGRRNHRQNTYVVTAQ